MELKNLIDGYKRCPAKSKERKISAWASLKPISSIETNWRNRKHIDRRKLVHRSNEDAVTKKSLISPSYEHPPKLPKNLKDRLRLREALATRSLGNGLPRSLCPFRTLSCSTTRDNERCSRYLFIPFQK